MSMKVGGYTRISGQTVTGAIRPKYVWDFTTGTLPSDVTSTTTVSSTTPLVPSLWDSSGYISFAPNNLIKYSNEFTNAVWNNNGAYGSTATATANAAIAPDGTNTAYQINFNVVSGSQSRRTQAITSANAQAIGGNKTYIFSCYVKKGNSSTIALIIDTNSAGSNWDRAYPGVSYNFDTDTIDNAAWGGRELLSNGWVRLWCKATSVNSTTSGWCGFISSVVGNTYTYVWKSQLEICTYGTTPSTHITTTTQAVIGPRLDYVPGSSTIKGLLIEPARNNKFLNSEAADLWVAKNNLLAFGSGSTINATLSPSNELNADLVVPNTSSIQHLIAQNASTVAGIKVSSVFVKSAGYNYFKWYTANETSGNSVTLNVNLSTGTIDGVNSSGAANWGSVTTPIIRNVGNGWYHVISIINVATTDSVVSDVIFCDSSYNTAIAGNGTSGLYMWGINLINYTIPPPADISSYIFTSALANYNVEADALSISVPSNVSALMFVFDDDSTQVVPAASGSTFAIPSNLNRRWIKKINGF